jgi:transposase-like protein
MAVMIAGRQFRLWRAVDDEGDVLDLLVQRRRDKAAAAKLFRKLLKKQGFAPEVLVTDKLRSYVSNRRDQLSASYPFMPPSKTRSTSSAILYPAARAAFSDRKPSGRGEPQSRPESELGFPIFARPNSASLRV